MKQTVRDTSFREGETLILLDRAYWPDGTLLTNAATGTYGVSATAYRIYDLDGTSPSTTIYSSGSVSTLSFASNQTDGYWTRDNDGYNLRASIPSTAFESVGGHRYRVEVVLTPHSGNSFGSQFLVYEAVCEAVVTQ